MLLDAGKSLLVLVDLQAGLMPKIVDTDRVTAVAKKLVDVAHELTVPVIVTEHYPEGLKATIPEVVKHLGEDYRPLCKKVFSAYEWMRRADTPAFKKVLPHIKSGLGVPEKG